MHQSAPGVRASDLSGWSWLDAMIRDFRLAARALARSRGFTLAVITSLALGLTFVAATVAIVNAYLFRPLPYPDAGRLFHVMYAPPGPWEPAGVSNIDWNPLRDIVAAPVTAQGTTFYIGDGGYSAPARAVRGAPDFLDALGVRAAIGRKFTKEDFAPGAEPVALIGDAIWRSRFGADRGVVGRVIHADVEGDSVPSPGYRVIGVLPPGFWFGRESSSIVDVITPLQERAQTYMVRLRPGVSVAMAERRITEATRQVATDIPADWTGVHLESMRDRYVMSLRPVLLAITIAAVLVLVIVCANIAVLTLLRAMRRQKEMSVRVALGAGWQHIARMIGAETLLLGVIASTAAVLLTRLVLQLLAPLIQIYLGRPAPSGAASVRIDPTVLVVVGGVALLIALSLAFLPLLMPWRRRIAGALHGSGRSTTDSPSMRRTRLTLIAVEVAGSLVLLATSGSLLRNVARMVHADLGFRAEHVVHMGIVVPGRAYPDTNALLAFYQRMRERIGAAVRSPVTFASWPRYADLPSRPMAVDGRPDERIEAGYSFVGPDFFAMLSIPIRQGREFSASDLPGSEPVAIVSEALARRLWPGQSPIGRRIRTIQTYTAALSPQWRTIVGIAGDIRQTYDDRVTGDVYIPFYQATPDRYGAIYFRSDRPAPFLLKQLRTTIGVSDPLAIVRGVNTLPSENGELAAAKFLTTLLTSVAAFAAFLALLGIYGVIAYGVRQRQREIAIRVAIGATGRMVTALFLRHGGMVLMLGTAAGLAVSIAMGRVLASRLAGFRQFDVVTLAAASGFMLVTGLLAVWWPARRAARTSPVEILNAE
jgi:putative ABC transport system permease protein